MTKGLSKLANSARQNIFPEIREFCACISNGLTVMLFRCFCGKCAVFDPAVRALRRCGGALVALQRGRRCHAKAAPSQTREGLLGRQIRFFGRATERKSDFNGRFPVFPFLFCDFSSVKFHDIMMTGGKPTKLGLRLRNPPQPSRRKGA